MLVLVLVLVLSSFSSSRDDLVRQCQLSKRRVFHVFVPRVVFQDQFPSFQVSLRFELIVGDGV